MKKLCIALLISFSLFGGNLFATTQTAISTVQAQESIQLDFGSTAKEKNVIGTENYNPDDAEAGFGSLIGQILNIVAVIAALMVFIYLLWGGIEWITAGGDKGKIEKAKEKITQSIIGLIVLAGMVALFAILQVALGFEIFNFT